ncbi:MAG: NUDIX hydrolase [Woeseiaceae bacterium]|nr:NUDIX hydrolase [Woeseiaceae bacterium]
MIEPLPSSTVVVVRDSNRGPEILLVRRRAGDAFGESYTFPGGVLDPDEADARPMCSGLAPADADALLGVDAGALDYYSAVVRELFEETGVLLGSNAAVDERLRDQLHDGSLAWKDLLRSLDLLIPCGELQYFAHWITPSALPKRWSTRFFLAAVPEGQQVQPDGSEITDYCWATVDEAMASAQSGERKIPFPTQRTIESLAGKESVAALMAWAREQQAAGIPAIQPEIGTDDGKRRIFMPEIGD